MMLENIYSLVAQRLKHLLAMWETWVWSLGWEDPLEKEMATHSSILAWRIPWMEELGGLQSTGHKESDTTEWIHFLCILATSSSYLLLLLGPYHFFPLLCPSLHEIFGAGAWKIKFLRLLRNFTNLAGSSAINTSSKCYRQSESGASKLLSVKGQRLTSWGFAGLMVSRDSKEAARTLNERAWPCSSGLWAIVC